MGHLAVFVFSAIPLFTESLLRILNSENGLKVIGNSNNIPGVLNQFKIRIPDILIADDSCVEKAEFINFTTALLKSPVGSKTIIFTGSNNGLYLRELVNQGI